MSKDLEQQGLMQQGQDPIVELKNKELELRGAEIQRKAQESMMQFRNHFGPILKV